MVAISREDLRQPLVVWLARREAAAGRRPLRIVLVARWQDIPRPPFASLAAQPETSTWRQKRFFSVWVTPALLGEVAVG